MNPCHRHLAVPTDFGIPSGVCLSRKLVEVVRHAAEFAYMVCVFFRQPFLYITVSETFPHILARRCSCIMCLRQQAEVVGCRHLHTDAITQPFSRSFLRATSLVTFPFLFHAIFVYCEYCIDQRDVPPCNLSGGEQAVSVHPKHKLATSQSSKNEFRAAPIFLIRNVTIPILSSSVLRWFVMVD